MLSPRHLRQWKDTKAPEDLPGLGQHYCVECAKWFETEISLVGHQKGKPHKRRFVPSRHPLHIWSSSYCPTANYSLRVKQLKEEPYTQKEAEAVVGLRTDNKGPSKGGPERAIDQEVEMET